MDNHLKYVEELQKHIQDLEFQIKSFKKEIHGKNVLLGVIYSSKTWRLGQLYGRVFGIESSWRKKLPQFLYRVLRSKRQKIKVPKMAFSSLKIVDAYSGIIDFLSKDSSGKGIFIIIATPQIQGERGLKGDQYTNRALRLANELSNLGHRILYVCSVPRKGFIHDEIEHINSNILQIGIDLFLMLYREIFKRFSSLSKMRTLLIQSLHPYIIEMLSYADAFNWKTVYDIFDNWEECYKEDWHCMSYNRQMEEFIVKNVDITIAVSDFLQKKFRSAGNVYIVHNGYSQDIYLNDYTKTLDKGEITIGYFGDFHHSRFDWNLLLSIDKRQKNWLFYLIGQLPENIPLQENMISLGRVNPPYLSAYAKNWDVAIVPFKVNNLTISCDNLKIYEYLYFRLPVVAKGVGEHVKSFPYVYISETEKEFEEYIRIAASQKLEENTLAEFLKQSDWAHRAKEMVHIIESNKSVYKEFIFEDPVYS